MVLQVKFVVEHFSYQHHLVNNMKYKVSQKVLIYEPLSGKILEAKIIGITNQIFEQFENCLYTCLTNNGTTSGIPESLIFEKKGDVIDWATNIAVSNYEPFNNDLM